jgi:hypothetical protein
MIFSIHFDAPYTGRREDAGSYRLAAFLKRKRPRRSPVQAGFFPSPALSGSGSAGVISGITVYQDDKSLRILPSPAKTVNHPDIGV